MGSIQPGVNPPSASLARVVEAADDLAFERVVEPLLHPGYVPPNASCHAKTAASRAAAPATSASRRTARAADAALA